MTREECDRLTQIIKSRVVDSPITGGQVGRTNDIPDWTVLRGIILQKLWNAIKDLKIACHNLVGLWFYSSVRC